MKAKALLELVTKTYNPWSYKASPSNGVMGEEPSGKVKVKDLETHNKPSDVCLRNIKRKD